MQNPALCCFPRLSSGKSSIGKRSSRRYAQLIQFAVAILAQAWSPAIFPSPPGEPQAVFSLINAKVQDVADAVADFCGRQVRVVGDPSLRIDLLTNGQVSCAQAPSILAAALESRGWRLDDTDGIVTVTGNEGGQAAGPWRTTLAGNGKPSLKGGALHVEAFRLKHVFASDVKQMLRQLLGSTGEGDVRLAVDVENNTLYLRAGNEQSLLAAWQLIEWADRPATRPGNTGLVYLRHVRALTLAESLRNVFGTRTLRAVDRQVQVKNGTATEALAGVTTIQGADRIRVAAAGDGSNALVLTAPAPMYDMVRMLIEKLDVPQGKVMLDLFVTRTTAANTPADREGKGLAAASVLVEENEETEIRFAVPGEGRHAKGDLAEPSTGLSVNVRVQGLMDGRVRVHVTQKLFGTEGKGEVLSLTSSLVAQTDQVVKVADLALAQTGFDGKGEASRGRVLGGPLAFFLRARLVDDGAAVPSAEVPDDPANNPQLALDPLLAVRASGRDEPVFEPQNISPHTRRLSQRTEVADTSLRLDYVLRSGAAPRRL